LESMCKGLHLSPREYTYICRVCESLSKFVGHVVSQPQQLGLVYSIFRQPHSSLPNINISALVMHCFHVLSTLTVNLFSVGLVGAVPSPVHEVSPRQAVSCNTPTDRACWTTGFTVSTDYEASTPFTGVTQVVRSRPPLATNI
jgi:hypothetical protein